MQFLQQGWLAGHGLAVRRGDDLLIDWHFLVADDEFWTSNENDMCPLGAADCTWACIRQG